MIKKNIEEAIKILDATPFPNFNGEKMYAEEDDNGVVHFKNAEGHTYMMLSREDYDNILAWKLQEN